MHVNNCEMPKEQSPYCR